MDDKLIIKPTHTNNPNNPNNNGNVNANGGRVTEPGELYDRYVPSTSIFASLARMQVATHIIFTSLSLSLSSVSVS